MKIEGKVGLTKDTKLAMISQFLGFMLDAYDMALGPVMAPILVKTFSIPTGSEAWQYITIVLTYSISMAARPVGSAIFGHYADTIGRRFLLILTIGGVGVLSLISAVSYLWPDWSLGIYYFCSTEICNGVFLWRRVCRRAHFCDRMCPTK